MFTQSPNTNPPPNNNALADEYLTAMKVQIAEAQQLIAQLQALFGMAASLEAALAQAKAWGVQPLVARYEAQLALVNHMMKQIEAQLNVIDPGLSAFDNAISSLETGVYTAALHGDANINEDLKMFKDYLNQLCEAMQNKLIADEYREKMNQDGDNNNDLLSDSLKMMQAESKEGNVLAGLQLQMSNDLVTLNKQKNDAQTDLDSYRWYDDVFSFGTDEGAKEHDRAIIRNSNDMRHIILGVMSDIAPELAVTQNQSFEEATLTLDKVLDKVLKILQDKTLSPQQQANQVKYLMALALGILAMIQTDAAQEKSQNQQTMAKSGTYATSMNISDEQARLKQLENDLAYARTMGILMKIAKPLLEVSGCLLAPGLGSFLVMLIFAIADSAGLTDKLVNALAKAGLGKVGAEILVGAVEVGATVGGGMALDKILATATKQALVVATEQTAAAAAKAIEETIQKVLAQAGKVGDAAAETAVRTVVTETVEIAVKSAVEKTVQQFNNQAASTLIPQLLKAGSKEGLTAMIAKAVEENCIIAAGNAVKAATDDIALLAAFAANGAKVAPAEIEVVSSRAANEAVAKLTDSTPKEVAEATAQKSAARTALSRAGFTIAYNAFNDGALTSATEAALKKAGLKADDESFIRVLEIIKVIESILASLAVMYGTGMFQSVVMNGSATTLLKAGTIAQIVGTGAEAISIGGQADAESQQAGAVKAINKDSVSDTILQMLMQQFNQQGDLDRKHFENQMNEQASNYTVVSQLENSGKELANILSQQAV